MAEFYFCEKYLCQRIKNTVPCNYILRALFTVFFFVFIALLFLIERKYFGEKNSSFHLLLGKRKQFSAGIYE